MESSEAWLGLISGSVGSGTSMPGTRGMVLAGDSTQRTGEGHSRSVWNIGVPQTLHAPVFVPAITPISGCQSLPVQRETDTEMFRWPFTTAVSSQSLPLHMP